MSLCWVSADRRVVRMATTEMLNLEKDQLSSHYLFEQFMNPEIACCLPVVLERLNLSAVKNA